MWLQFIYISSGCQIQKVHYLKHRPQLKAANEAAHAGHFETTEGVTVQISALRPRGITIDLRKYLLRWIAW